VLRIQATSSTTSPTLRKTWITLFAASVKHLAKTTSSVDAKLLHDKCYPLWPFNTWLKRSIDKKQSTCLGSISACLPWIMQAVNVSFPNQVKVTTRLSALVAHPTFGTRMQVVEEDEPVILTFSELVSSNFKAPKVFIACTGSLPA